MARVTYIKKAQAAKNPRRCHCGHEVQVGESYKYVAKRFGGSKAGYKIFFCKDHSPRMSDLSSGRQSEVHALIEGFDEEVTAVREKVGKGNSEDARVDLKEAIETVASDIETLAEEIREGVSNIEQNFGPTYQTEAMEETATELERWKGDIESLVFTVDDDTDVEELIQETEALLGDQPELNLTG